MSTKTLTTPTTPTTTTNIIYKRFIAGTISGIALTLVGHPLDTLKVLLQTSNHLHTSLTKTTTELIKQDGLRGFYRGMSTPLLFTGFVNTLLWGIQFNLVDKISTTPSSPTTMEVMEAAIISGALISFVVTPMELVKSRRQVLADGISTKSPIQIAKSVYQQQGIMNGLYRGWFAVVLCRASNWAYFGGYAFANQHLSQLFPTSSSRTRAICAGGFAGWAYWFAAFPFDVIKARMMSESNLSQRPKNNNDGFLGTANNIYQQHGLKGFTKGFLPCILRAFPANAAAFLGFETAMKILN
jgi:solute carrier family 25 carnitine/acylcarnitine transporter 20/29